MADDLLAEPRFRPDGAVQYDQRMSTWKGRDAVSILTLSGRIIVPVVYREWGTAVAGDPQQQGWNGRGADRKTPLAGQVAVKRPPHQGPSTGNGRRPIVCSLKHTER